MKNWLGDLKKGFQVMHAMRHINAELHELHDANNYPVSPPALLLYDSKHSPVKTLTHDLARISVTPGMTQLIAMVAGEQGGDLNKFYQEMFGHQWRDKMTKTGIWEDPDGLIKGLGLYAQAHNQDADRVYREYELRRQVVEKGWQVGLYR